MSSDNLLKSLLGAVSRSDGNGTANALTSAMHMLGSLGASGASQPGAGTSHNGLLNAALSILGDKNAGGMAGLVNAFKSSGLEHEVASWISTGKNLPISAEQISKVFGATKLQQLADHAGTTTTSISTLLAQFLPAIVDQLTPHGQLPDESALQSALGQMQKLAANS